MSKYARASDWETGAKCLTLNTLYKDEAGDTQDIFYPPRDKELYKPVADAAKGLCKGKDGLPACPVKKQCLLRAIETDETFGIWGGQSHRERNALVRKSIKLGVSVESLVDLLDSTWQDEDDDDEGDE